MRSDGKIEENCLIQILDDFLSAQADEKSSTAVTGPELRDFCDRMLNAERDRSRNKSIYFLQMIFLTPFIICLIIFIRSFLYTKPGHFLENINNLHIEGYEFYYILIFITGLLFKKQISVLFFHHSRLLRKVETVVYIFIIGTTFIFASILSVLVPISIPIAYPVYSTIFFITIIAYIVCWLYKKKAKVVHIKT